MKLGQLCEDLIICNRCGQEHGPSEAKHVIRYTCGHCGKTADTNNYEVPMLWSHVMKGTVIRFALCPDCTVLHEQWMSGPTIEEGIKS